MNMIATTYVLFLLGKGLNLFEVNLVNTVFFVTLFVCEIPTGAFADVFGRKKSYVLSCFLLALGMMVYAISDTFWEFACAEMISAIGMTFSTGAFSSWLVDSLKHHTYEGETRAIFARGAQLRQGAGILAALIGAYLFDISPSLPWIVGGGLFGIAGTIAWFVMREEYFVREKFSWKGGLQALNEVTRMGLSYGASNAHIRFLMMLVLGLSISTMSPNMQWQPFFKDWVPNQTSLGFVWTGAAVAMLVGAWCAPHLLRMMRDERRALLICNIVVALGIIGTVTVGAMPVAFAAFLIHELARGAIDPIKESYLHDNIPSKARATLVSFESIAHHLGGAVGLVLSGALAEYGSIQLAWVVSGGILLVVVFLLRK